MITQAELKNLFDYVDGQLVSKKNIKSLPPNRYWYCCKRCGNFIKAILKEKQ